MAAPSLAPRLTDILEAIEHIRSEMSGVTIEAFEADWRRRWLVERGVEVISEASRRLAKLVQDDLTLLERVCREELARARGEPSGQAAPGLKR